jgi:CelD/BcsL family acetyltransferase involved in cellulose biosynthesis
MEMAPVLELPIEPRSITVQQITTIEELESLRNEWMDLWLRCPEATPFQSPAWLISWWQRWGAGELWVLSLRRGERLVGVAPFHIHQGGPSSETHLMLLGTGVSDCLDVLLSAEAREQGLQTILGCLEADAYRWDKVDFQQLRSGSCLLEMAVSPDWTSQTSVQEVCPVLRLRGGPDPLGQSVPRHMLQKLRYARCRLASMGRVEVTMARPGASSLNLPQATRNAQATSPGTRNWETRDGDFPELFENFLELRRARWAAGGQSGALPAAALHEFHHDVARGFLSAGALRLYGLRLDGRLIADLYAFSHGKRTFYYSGGFDPAYAQLSPGTLMLGWAIEQAIREGNEEFDFLRGRQAYKYLWGAKGRLNYRRQWHRRA